MLLSRQQNVAVNVFQITNCVDVVPSNFRLLRTGRPSASLDRAGNARLKQAKKTNKCNALVMHRYQPNM